MLVSVKVSIRTAREMWSPNAPIMFSGSAVMFGNNSRVTSICQRTPGEPYRVQPAAAGVKGLAFFACGVGVVAAANACQCDNLICFGFEIVGERKDWERQRQSGNGAIHRSSAISHGD